MAKLTGVKTIDMANGVITAIEYGGAVYAKVVGDSKVGDVLLRTSNGIEDIVQVGNFYVRSIAGGFGERIGKTWYLDEDGERLTASLDYFATFRKASTSAPFAEMVMAKVDAVERKVAAIEAKLAPEVGAQPKPKTGDIVVITANTNGSRNDVGDIGKVGETTPISVVVDVLGKTSGNGNNTKYSDMRIATPAEIAKYESAVAQVAKDSVFIKAGRKPNKYRKGDLVRVSDDDDYTITKGNYGEVARHYGIGGGGNVVMSCGSIVLGMDVEIVCFAENRADLAKGAC